jgi:stage III sporulation protein SpoIIIAA
MAATKGRRKGRCRHAIGLIVHSTGEEHMDRSLRSLGAVSAISIAALVALGIAPAASAQQWKPTKPITIIVPWAAGGSTDQVTRVTAGEIEKALGQKVIVVNQRVIVKCCVRRFDQAAIS